MADIDDLTFADNPYDEDGVNLRLNSNKPTDKDPDLVQRLELPEQEFDLQPHYGLPTQVVHPWRTVVRTLVQHVSGLIVAGLIWLLASIGVDVSELGPDLIISVSVLLTLFFSGVAARIMALPQVEDFFAKYITPFSTGVSEE